MGVPDLPTRSAGQPVEDRPSDTADTLVDTFGRLHRDLRISVTDRCNFRCTYCMPVEGMTWLPRSEILSFEEIERVARICVEQFGVDSLRLTGGEPTARAHLPVLVDRLARLRVRGERPVDVAMTTNGATLRSQAAELAAAGLRRVNISLDTLRPDRFREMTRRDQLADVLDGIDAALAADLTPVKINAVVQRGVNDDEIVDLAVFGRERGVSLRFIEWMPLDASETWRSDAVVSQAEIVDAIGSVFPLQPVRRGSAPAERFVYEDGAGEIGVIPSVTRPFCDSCDRLRLTADGQLRSCLFATEEIDVRPVLRDETSQDEASQDEATQNGSERSGDPDADRRNRALADLIRRCVAEKKAGHLIGQVTFVRPRRSMSQIGG